jgi:hypothetical protein
MNYYGPYGYERLAHSRVFVSGRLFTVSGAAES